MIGRRPRPEQGNGTRTISVVPVVLPHVEVHLNGGDTATVRVDGDAHPDSPVPRHRLGEALSRVAAEQGCAVRVEVHHQDGRVYADIIDPPPPETVADEHEQPGDQAVGVEVSASGFLPGEPVHIAVTVRTETADSTGRLTTYLDATQLDGGAVVVVFGAVSGTTIVQERP